MPITYVKYTLKATNRTDIRKKIISLFLKENPGNGTGANCSRYRYTVQTFKKYSIILNRPAGLNKGFDFTVNISGMNFKKKRTYSNPSHQDIINILQSVKANYLAQYHLVAAEINNIYNGSALNLKSVSGITFADHTQVARPIEIILLAIKWLFIEQDVTYWNWSGRNMLFSKLKNLGLA